MTAAACVSQSRFKSDKTHASIQVQEWLYLSNISAAELVPVPGECPKPETEVSRDPHIYSEDTTCKGVASRKGIYDGWLMHFMCKTNLKFKY